MTAPHWPGVGNQRWKTPQQEFTKSNFGAAFYKIKEAMNIGDGFKEIWRNYFLLLLGTSPGSVVFFYKTNGLNQSDTSGDVSYRSVFSSARLNLSSAPSPGH
jgi:hypothetical protein